MSVVRTCLPCRGAKAKCDRARPICGRCRLRGLTCSGLPTDSDFIFRDENETSQRNSKRARREVGERLAPPISFIVQPAQVTDEQQPQTAGEVLDPHLQLQYPWLNDRTLAEGVALRKIDPETRAVDRFFVNWTLYPGNEGQSPGHMHNLLPLYRTAPPQSVLWLAVHAVACADMRHESVEGTPFHIRARQYYGAALGLLREVAHEGQGLANDQVLAAILLIDNFEKMYLARIDPLGAHVHAIRHILHAGSDDYLSNESSFALGCLAHKRLQFRQILLREEPDPEQITWVSKLNVEQPDIHITVDVLHMNVLSAAVKKLTHRPEDIGGTVDELVEQSRQLVRSIQDLIPTVDSWTSTETGLWKRKPRVRDPRCMTQSRAVDRSLDVAIPHFSCPTTLSYQSLWLAFLWNFHAASQIVLRESLVDAITYSAAIQGRELNHEETERIRDEQEAVDKLSSAIVQSYPPLLGLTLGDEREPRSPPQGKMAGRFFTLCSAWVIQMARCTSLEHKQTAVEVIRWVNDRHGLG